MKAHPCPFDGADANVVNVSTLQWIIECSECHVTLPTNHDEFFVSKEEAVAKWNSRVLPLELKEVLEDALEVMTGTDENSKIGLDSTVARIKWFLGMGKHVE